MRDSKQITITISRHKFKTIKKFCEENGRKISPFMVACALNEIKHHEKHFIPVKRGFWR